MTWATKRKLQYLGGIFGIFIIVLFIFLYPIIFKKPTCFDGKQNGDEAGVDCGGSCMKMCLAKTSEPLVLWSRAFPVVGNFYNLAAYVENQNRNSAIENITYQFVAYDENNRMIGRREGQTFIPPNKQFAIFEPRFDAGQSKVKSVTFEFTEPFNWVKREPTINNLALLVDNISMGQDKSNPSLSAVVKNDSIYDIPSFDVIAILYDVNHNAINVSKTIKDGLHSNSSLPVFFTWPTVLASDPVVEDVLVSINPFSVSF
jgi:hypothetical protein